MSHLYESYDFAAYWKMLFIDVLLSVIDGQPNTYTEVMWFIDVVLQYLGQGDYLTFFGIFSGLLALRTANRLIQPAELKTLLPEEPLPAKTEGYGAAYVVRRRRRGTKRRR